MSQLGTGKVEVESQAWGEYMMLVQEWVVQVMMRVVIEHDTGLVIGMLVERLQPLGLEDTGIVPPTPWLCS